MAQQLVADVGLGGVERPRRVADVLRRVEHAEREAREEVARGEQAGHGAQGEARAVSEEVGYVFKLWDVVLPEAAVLDEEGKDMVVLPAGVFGEKLGELAEHFPPGLRLFGSVVHVRQRLTVLVVVREVGEVLPPGAVLFVREARVVRVQLGAVREDLVRETVQLTDATREPWHRAHIVLVVAGDDAEVGGALSEVLDGRAQVASRRTLHHELVLVGHAQ